MSDAPDKSQKIHPPSPKRIEEARRKGDIPQSQEIKHWFMLLGGGLAIFVFAGDVAAGLRQLILKFLEHPHDIRLDNMTFAGFLAEIGGNVAIVLFLPILVLVAAALIGNSVVAKPTWSPEKLKPSLDKFSLIKGAKRIFGSRGWVELGKAIFKLAVVGAVAGLMILPDMQELKIVPTMDPIDIVRLIERLAMIMIATVIVVMAFIAVADMMFQKYKWTEDHKMTQQEVKEERKQQEGDPQIKARIRRVRMERAAARVTTAVPNADVVIANPTHYAVALQYDESAMAAPRLVAKGLDHLALRIREIAEENDVPVIENPPLARAIYNDVEIDQEIPSQFYKAAAEIIGYVLRLKGRLPGPPGPMPKVEYVAPGD